MATCGPASRQRLPLGLAACLQHYGRYEGSRPRQTAMGHGSRPKRRQPAPRFDAWHDEKNRQASVARASTSSPPPANHEGIARLQQRTNGRPSPHAAHQLGVMSACAHLHVLCALPTGTSSASRRARARMAGARDRRADGVGLLQSWAGRELQSSGSHPSRAHEWASRGPKAAAGESSSPRSALSAARLVAGERQTRRGSLASDGKGTAPFGLADQGVPPALRNVGGGRATGAQALGQRCL